MNRKEKNCKRCGKKLSSNVSKYFVCIECRTGDCELCGEKVKTADAKRCKKCLNIGKIRTKETKAKISKSKRGIPLSKVAKKNIANAVRRGFKDGTRRIWNKGKKWSPEMKEHFRNKTLELLKSGRHKYSDTIPEKQVQAYFDGMRISYVKQRKFGKFSFDFYLKGLDIYVEVDGDYWHGNPLYYTTLNDVQENKKKIDQAKDEYMRYHDKKFVRIWQSEINKVWRIIN